MLGLASTYEPGRWRFNAVALYTYGGGGGEYETGSSLFSELSVGNRFWLEPYPGPFMRLDFILRHRHSDRARMGGMIVPLVIRSPPSRIVRVIERLPSSSRSRVVNGGPSSSRITSWPATASS